MNDQTERQETSPASFLLPIYFSDSKAYNGGINLRSQEGRIMKIANKSISSYVGNVGDKITSEVTLAFESSYNTQYGTTYIYSFKDADGNTLIWKTSSYLMADGIIIRRGDVIRITATIKAHSEYKGEAQTMLQRVKVMGIISNWIDRKADDQLASLEEGDHTWTMPYRQYKDHYRDCETVAGSYDEDRKTIRVIIRAGRMKASGTRDQHYAGYEFKNQNGKLVTYRAVSYENALKRCQKEFPEDNWEINHIYFYERH